MNDSTLVLTESKSARADKMGNVTHDSAMNALCKAKALVMAMWQGVNVATTEQMADYYQVPVETIKTILLRNRDELASDGVRTIKGKELKDVRFTVNLTSEQSKAPSLNIWTPRAALRLGMLLRDSEVAKQVRTVLLDVAMIVPKQNDELEALRLRVQLAEAERDAAIAQKNLLDKREAVNQFHNQTTAALILGATIITDKTPIERTIMPDGRVFEGVGITAIAKKLGFKNTKDCWQWLESIGYGKDSKYWDLQLSAVEHHKLHPEAYDEILNKWNQGVRQRFIGE